MEDKFTPSSLPFPKTCSKTYFPPQKKRRSTHLEPAYFQSNVNLTTINMKKHPYISYLLLPNLNAMKAKRAVNPATPAHINPFCHHFSLFTSLTTSTGTAFST